MLDLVRSYNVAEVIALEKLHQSITAEEVCRATRRVEDESILLLQLRLHLIRQLLGPVHQHTCRVAAKQPASQ